MAHFDPGPPPQEYTAPVLKRIMERLMTAINYIDKANFKNKISGNDILADWSVGFRKLPWQEYVIPLVMAAPVFSTTNLSGAPANPGGYFPWHPDKFTGGTWYFEADISIADGASTASARLTDGTDLKTVTTQQTGLFRVRSDAITMPESAANLWVQVWTSNASHAASLGGAKLIFIPN